MRPPQRKRAARARSNAIPARERFFNRETSWLEFNRKVLDEAANPDNPLLERLRFLSIFESNLDEFYMVRVSGLIEQAEDGNSVLSPDGLTPKEQLSLVTKASKPLRASASTLWKESIRPLLAREGIEILEYKQLGAKQKKQMQVFFQQEVFNLCTPLILHPAEAVPFISNRSLNLAVELTDGDGQYKLARVKIPTVVPRLVKVWKSRNHYLLVEDVIRNNLASLFPGVDVLGAHTFRVVRDADIEIRELEAGDLVETVQESLRLRRFGDPVHVEVEAATPTQVKEMLRRALELEPQEVSTIEGLIGLDVLSELAELDRPDLRFAPHTPYRIESANNSTSLFELIAEAPILMHHPFDSFKPVSDFVAASATDPGVIGIKQTLYRVGAHSPIVLSLSDAAEAGKQVAVVVELKARFDESNNILWARALERAGAHVTLGFPDIKIHAKLCLVVRREGRQIRTYAHIGTGNYNPSTARQYTDFGLFTSDPDIVQDVAELFNFLTGFSKQRNYRKLLVAPSGFRLAIIERIRRETKIVKRGKPGWILLKMNSLDDPEVIDALYEASESGVRVDLLVRGICRLRPGVAGLSSNIKVYSVVGRFLEHSRFFYFNNGGKHEGFIGSADLMRRNLDRRVEVAVPVEDERQLSYLVSTVMHTYLADNTNCWELRPDGSYKRRSRPKGGPGICAQTILRSKPAGLLVDTHDEIAAGPVLTSPA